MMIMENITTAKLSLDFHQSEEYKQTDYMEKLLFILHYAIIIPFILFFRACYDVCAIEAGYHRDLNAECAKILKVV